ncbi:hypothetical protein QBC38DRAFT_464150 [Podospora fimiseda]|uniref:WW domain-containing protein n=1 Tax=Podospora fimiseda TaxID=252190 RepID=A0AAN7H8F5_9PEZI|nr:hypothetical protein QBC38DRAFT_464150 [Podospora fimiseda]
MSTSPEPQKSPVAPDLKEAEPKLQKESSSEPTENNDATKEEPEQEEEEKETNPSHEPSPSDDDSSSSEDEEGEISESEQDDAPPLPNEPLPDSDSAPPLPNEAPPLPSEPLISQQQPEDDGWDFHWNPNDNSYWFYNRFTQIWQKENPRLQTTSTTLPVAIPSNTDISGISDPTSLAGGYNPAIHGSYDENAWYAVGRNAPEVAAPSVAEYATAAFFNKATGQWQMPDQGAERHSDEAKSRRQLNAFFDVDAAANSMHDGKSLKAERAGKKPSRKELREFKEKRRQRKEERRRAWLKD